MLLHVHATNDWAAAIERALPQREYVRSAEESKVRTIPCMVVYCMLLYCFVLYCIVLYCIVLFCSAGRVRAVSGGVSGRCVSYLVCYGLAWHCTIPCMLWYGMMLYCFLWRCMVLYCPATPREYVRTIHFIVVYCIVLLCPVWLCMLFYCASPAESTCGLLRSRRCSSRLYCLVWLCFDNLVAHRVCLVLSGFVLFCFIFLGAHRI